MKSNTKIFILGLIIIFSGSIFIAINGNLNGFAVIALGIVICCIFYNDPIIYYSKVKIYKGVQSEECS